MPGHIGLEIVGGAEDHGVAAPLQRQRQGDKGLYVPHRSDSGDRDAFTHELLNTRPVPFVGSAMSATIGPRR